MASRLRHVAPWYSSATKWPVLPAARRACPPATLPLWLVIRLSSVCCVAALPQADVPAEVRQGLEVVACSRLEDVLAAAFDPPIRLAPQPLLARL